MNKPLLTIKRKYKRLIFIPVIALFGALVWFVTPIRDAFDYYFLHMLRLSIACFNDNLFEYGVIILIIQIIAWLVVTIMLYFGVFNILFPRIRGVNEMRTRNTYARKVIQIDGPDDDYVYLKVKFTLFPIFDWFTMKIPKPNKHSGVEWRRMPSSIDILMDDINLSWDSKKRTYHITGRNVERIEDDVKTYRDKSNKNIKRIGENVGSAIQGDSNMMKDYYTMNLVMDENKEPIPKNKLKRPPGEVEKEIGGE